MVAKEKMVKEIIEEDDLSEIPEEILEDEEKVVEESFE